MANSKEVTKLKGAPKSHLVNPAPCHKTIASYTVPRPPIALRPCVVIDCHYINEEPGRKSE